MKSLVGKQSIFGFLSSRATRVVLAVLIVTCMGINGFVPKSVENRGSLIIIMTAVAGNVIAGTFKECTDTLVVMSNKITKNLYKYIFSGFTGSVGQTNQKSNERKDPMPVNTASDNCLKVDRKTARDNTNNDLSNNILGLRQTKTQDRLYILYNNLKQCGSQSGRLGIIFFILFIIVLRSRKGYDIETLTSRQNKYKTDLC
mgnify:CR=1 FL=1